MHLIMLQKFIRKILSSFHGIYLPNYWLPLMPYHNELWKTMYHDSIWCKFFFGMDFLLGVVIM